mmetsp:Transcript_38506/g.124872  ORF Transcript_38506/g.124872 Transcript_38506/m.124872 type:complete len:218 (-) Transcript_38506:9-662(-)
MYGLAAGAGAGRGPAVPVPARCVVAGDRQQKGGRRDGRGGARPWRGLLTDSLGRRLFEVVDQVGHVLVVLRVASRNLAGAARLVRLGDLLEVGEVVGAELVDDAGQQLLQLLRLRLPAHHVGVRRDRRLHLWVVEVDDRPVVLEQVHLLNRGDVVDAQPLERVLQPLVVRRGRLVHRLLLSPHGALAASAHLRRHLCELLGIHGAPAESSSTSPQRC